MERTLFAARVKDALTLSERTSTPRFLGFLSAEEAAVAAGLLRPMHARFALYGGYPDAERALLCCMPDWCEEPDYPITPLTFRFRTCDRLSHRDFLGSLMALGLTRESVGDILTEPGRAVVFVKNEISGFITDQLEKVGGTGVTVAAGFDPPLPQAGTRVTESCTVASLRLDCVIGALCGLSRAQAAALIEEGRVSVAALPVLKPTKSVAPGDRIAVRGKGKFEIDETSGLSKKGRVILKYSKYI